MPPIRSIKDVAQLESQDYDALIPYRSPYEVLSHGAKTFGDQDALRFLHTGDPDTAFDVYSYRDLLDQVGRAANAFHRLGVKRGESVAFLLPSIPHAYFTLFGAETVAHACPINYLLQADHIAELLSSANATVLVALGPHESLDIWSKAAALKDLCPNLRHVLSVGEHVDGFDRLEDLMAAEHANELMFEPPRHRDGIAAYFHTGGTTATPKLTQHTQGNQVHAAWGAAQMYGMHAGDVIINGFPLFHVAGSFVYGLSAFVAGATIVLPTLLGMRNPTMVRHYWSAVERHKVTLLAGVPTVMTTLLNVPIQGQDVSSVRCMLTGGSPLPTELAAQFEAQYQWPVRNILGMTESAGVISIVPFAGERVPGSCGLRLPFTQIKVVALRDDEPDITRECAAGQTGVVLIKGPNVSPGYTDPKRNAGTFTPDGWLISGDLGYISERGELHINGRAKDVIIRSSHNIDPVAIEEVLLSHPAVENAAAVGAPDGYAGELPVAFVTLKPGQSVTGEDLLNYAAPLIPERPAIPKSITIIDTMPMTPIGKIFKPALRVLATRAVIAQIVEVDLQAPALRSWRVQEVNGKVTVVFETESNPSMAERINTALRSLPIDCEINAV